MSDTAGGSGSQDDVASATSLLLQFARDGNAQQALDFSGADVSPAAVAAQLAGEPCWDSGCNGLTLAGRKLAGASLRRVNLSHANLTGSDLSGVDGGGMDLSSSSLEGAKLVGADLIGAVFNTANGGEADFTRALLEDAKFRSSSLRFANFTDAILDGADLSAADLWGARLDGANAERANLEEALLDESSMVGAELPGANLAHATLRRARLAKAVLRDANLRGAVLDGADLSHADLQRATLPNVSLATSTLTHTRFAGAWLDRTRMHAADLGGMVGEEAAGDLNGAVDSYLVLEQNFRSLGKREDESWCYRRRRRVQKRLHLRNSMQLFQKRSLSPAFMAGARFLADVGAEWLCDYGDSIGRVLRAMLTIMVIFSLIYWVSGSLTIREGTPGAGNYLWINYLLFSLDSMTTVGTSEVALRPATELGVLLSGLQTAIGVMLLGLFGFVLGGRIRN